MKTEGQLFEEMASEKDQRRKNLLCSQLVDRICENPARPIYYAASSPSAAVEGK